MTLRGTATNSSSPSRKRSQPDDTYTGQGKASEPIAAVLVPNAVGQANALPVEQQCWQSSIQTGRLDTAGRHSPVNNAMTRLSSAAKGSRPDNAASSMKQSNGSYKLNSARHPEQAASDAVSKHATHKHASPVAPSPTQRHQAMRYAQHISTAPGKHDAAGCSHATRADTTSRGYSHEQQGLNQCLNHNGKRSQDTVQQQLPRHTQMANAAGSNLSKGSKASGGKADKGCEGLQHQDTLLGNWVRWEKPAYAQMVSLSCQAFLMPMQLSTSDWTRCKHCMFGC